MMTILIAGGCWLLAAVVAVVGAHLVSQRNLRRYRLEVGRRVADATRPPWKTLLARPPAGPAQDALRSAHLRLMLDKTEPRA